MDFPCGACIHFEQQFKNERGRPVPKQFGHCAALSVYTATPARPPPAGAKTAPVGTLGTMVCPAPTEIRRGCTSGVRRT